MKTILKITLFTLFLGGTSFYAKTQVVNVTDSFVYDGIYRTYYLYVPPIYTPSTAVPLILNLHGYTSNGFQQAFYSNFKPIADTANFILVYPNGTNDPINSQPFWNFGIFNATVDDKGFLEALIDTISTQYSIIQDRVYSVGMSNGGYMSYFLACNTNRFAAIGSVTGSMSPEMYNSCNSNIPVPVIEIHGTTDPTVPYGGNITSKAIEDVVAFWVTRNACNTTPIETQVPNINTTDGATATHYLYTGGTDGHTVEFFKVINGGHTWPGAPLPIPSAGNTCMDFNASKEIWRFFSQYQRSEEASIKSLTAQKISIYPNPATDQLFFVSDKSITSISLFDTQGRLVKQVSDLHITTLDISQLENGNYLIEITTDDGVIVKRMDVIH